MCSYFRVEGDSFYLHLKAPGTSIINIQLSDTFSRPLIIYDDKCSSCTKFARAAAALSRGWIRTGGHYYSQKVIEVKKIIFPADYDPTKMFWLINKKGAYGARLGLVQVAKEHFWID